MLEFLLFALFSPDAQNFLQKHPFENLPQIEILQPAKLPHKKSSQIAPSLLKNPKTAIFATDLSSGKSLLEKNSKHSQYIASLTKLMTALIILENHKLDEIVTIPLEATKTEGAKIDLYEYEQLTVGTLLEAILIPSANDAAIALAMYHSGSEKQFAHEMNKYAKKLGLNSAQFFNATGLDILTHEPIKDALPSFAKKKEKTYGNKMSAYDISQLAKLLLQHDIIRKIVQKNHFYGTSVDEKFFHEKKSTNQLLGTFLNLKGVKTGYTYLAGECFVALGEKDGQEILTVILGSEDRFGETKNFLSWIYEVYEWK